MINKKELRNFFIKERDKISLKQKIKSDNAIFSFFINSHFFREYDTFLIYVSVNNEVDTKEIINYLLVNNKKVAVPCCSGDFMAFYYINSFDELIDGKYGIPSVDTSLADKADFFENALCIVPAVSYDYNGNRLGYGGGYYDRFLSENNLPTLGLCYEKCISEFIPTENFDVKIDCVLTETHLRNHKLKEVSVYG